jgi:hypothetical protein
MSFVDVIVDNGNIVIQHDETFPTLAQGFMVKANRKRLRTLNIEQYIERYSSLQCGKAHN